MSILLKSACEFARRRRTRIILMSQADVNTVGDSLLDFSLALYEELCSAGLERRCDYNLLLNSRAW